jgi:hypothetical protein
MLACRACRIPLNADSGCALCNPIRKHLVLVGEDEDDRPSLSATGGEIVSALRKRLKAVDGALKHENDQDKIESLERRLIAIGNSASRVLESARKIQVDAVNVMDNMSFAEKAELFVEWVINLTPDYRKAFMVKMNELEIENNKPLQLEAKVTR